MGLALLGLADSPARAQTNFATIVPDGAWTWYNDPRALFHNGVLYVGCVRNSGGRTVLNAFNPQTGVGTELWASTLSQADDHNNPGLLVKQDGRMLAIYTRHASDAFFTWRLSTTTNPVSPADWGAEQTFTPSPGSTETYSNPYQLSVEGGLIYNFTRNTNFNPTVLTSTNGGASWLPPRLLIRKGASTSQVDYAKSVYVKYASDYSNRIDFLYTDGHPRNVTNSLYHACYRNGALYKTDGTFLKSFSDLPLLHDAGERGSVIYQYNTAAQTDPNQWIPTGRAWCWEIVSPSNGLPVAVFTVQRDQVTGTNWFDDRIYYYYARWTGTNWQKRFIAHAGRPLYTSEDDYAGGICLDPENSSVVYFSSNAQDPFDLANTTNVLLRANDRYELFRGVTTDGGLTFTWTPVTSNSPVDNLRPYMPRRHGGQPALVWFRGTYSSMSTFKTAVVGLFPNPVPQPPAVSIVSPAAPPVTLTNLGNKLSLQAAVTDDSLSGPLILIWTTASGPTNAAFSDPAGANTAASFPVAGAYTLRFTASNSAFSGAAEVAVQAGLANPEAPDASRVLWLKLDESSGTNALDSSGAGNHGTLAGGATWQPAGGVRAGALAFDGSTGVATVPDAPNLDNTSAMTLAYWFRANAYPPDSAGLVSKRDNKDSNNSFTTYLKAADQRIYVDIDQSNDRFASATRFQTGVWYHVTLVFDGALPTAQRAKLWVNGNLDVTAGETSATVPDFPSNFRLGYTPSGVSAWFAGSIDDVRFHRRALSPGEIQMLAGLAPNLAPSVATGPAPAATNGVAAWLSGTVADDGLGGSLSAWWSKVAGSRDVAFGNSNSPATAVTFSSAGAYILRLHATDTAATVFDDLAVNVSPNPNLYEDWIAQAFPGATNPAVIGFAADPDGDGARNLLEFALGLNPTIPDATHFRPGQAGLPIGAIMNFAGANYLTLQVQRPVGRLRIVYAAEVSGDFTAWVPAVQVGSPVDNGDGTELVTYRDLIPAGQATLRLIRLKITALVP